MKRTALYSSSSRTRAAAPTRQAEIDPVVPVETARPPRFPRLRGLAGRHRSVLLVIAGAGLAVGLMLAKTHLIDPAPVDITQADIDHAVRKSLEKKPLPSKEAKAYQQVQGSIVRVLGFGHEAVREREKGRSPTASAPASKPGKPEKDADRRDDGSATGTGVVVTDKGVILTNLHVVSGAERIVVVFANGMHAEASITGLDVRQDLAVIQAKRVPDDLHPATLASTRDIKPGDEVIAIGFPFGFGPSVSSGVISGLRREFQPSESQAVMKNLIQFDAAANPGNSGGPLVTMEGEVVGIVTAILNPNNQRSFVGLGFAVPIENASKLAGVPPF